MNTLPKLEETYGSHLRNGTVPAGGSPGSDAGGAPKVGRPCGCTGELVGMLRGLIRELGLSDSAAAQRLGIGASTLSRWKRSDPEVRLLLQQAREECRAVQLQRIMHAAAAEHGRGWRAAAWLLERLFPEDYMRDAGAREGHRSVAEARARREEEAAEAEARIQRARAVTAVVEPVTAQESDCRNYRNSAGADLSDANASDSTCREGSTGLAEGSPFPTGVLGQLREVQLRPQGHEPLQLGHERMQPVGGSGAFGGAALLEASMPQEGDITNEGDCQNCRNSVLDDVEELRHAL